MVKDMSTGYANGLREILLKRYQLLKKLVDDTHKTVLDFPHDELTQKGLQELYSVSELNRAISKLLDEPIYETIYMEMESDLEALDNKAADLANKTLKDHKFKED